MKISFYFTALAMLSAIVGCSESTVVEPPAVSGSTMTTVQDIQADTGKTGQFTFFSLRDSSVVSHSDSATSRWDIGFRGTTLIVNGGASGPGQGGALVLYNVDFDAVKEVPAQGYAVDTSATQLAIPTSSGNGWYTYNPETHIITPTTGVVIAVRTADGRYAKLKIVSYYKGAPTTPSATDLSRFYTIAYSLQTDGSTKFN